LKKPPGKRLNEGTNRGDEGASGGLPDRILIVDDDPFVRAVVTAVLKEAGVSRIKACASGEEALAVVADFQPRLVLLDYVMTGANGRVTWNAIRKLVRPAPLAIFLTARSEAEVAAEGVLGIIAKPFNPLTLGNELHTLMGRHASMGQGLSGAAGLERLAAVAAEYRRSLAPSADHLDGLWAKTKKSGWQRDQAEMLLAKAHSLAGSAGLFGLHELGAAAEAAEGLLSKALKRELAPDTYEMQELETAVVALIAACRK